MGGGRVVGMFFDLCNQIWSESPATENMSGVLDGAVDSTDAQSHSSESSTENIFQSRSSTLKQLVIMIGQANLMRMKILKAV